MACPYFVPVEIWPENGDGWTGPRRVPLGEPYRGCCSLTVEVIDMKAQATVCNFGYARQRCSHFPADGRVDAIRFTIPVAERLIWIAEYDHSPVEHGTGVPTAYTALAQAFMRSYRRGKAPQGLCR